jgi:ornithine cyclodeaminase
VIPIVEEATVRATVTPALAVDVIREAFRADGEGRAHVPAVINLEIPSASGEFHVKTAHIEGVPYVAVKIASGFYDNPSRGLPSGSGMMALFDAATGFSALLSIRINHIRPARWRSLHVLARPTIETVDHRSIVRW